MRTHLLQLVFMYSLVLCHAQCPFNNNCSCSSLDRQFSVYCTWDVPTFPIFSVYNAVPIYQITISVEYIGNETLTIPLNAFIALQSLQNDSFIYFTGTNYNCSFAPKIILSPGALNTLQNTTFYQIVFQYLYIPQLTAGSFEDVFITNLLWFYDSCIDFIEDYTFYGLSTSWIQVFNTGSANTSLKSLGLAGIQFTGDQSLALFQSAGLNDIQAFKFVEVYQLYVQSNTIFNISDFAFCTCNSLSECNNTVLKYVYLKNNRVQYVSRNAFANLLNLYEIDLSFNNIKTLGLENTVVNSLDLSYNALTNLDFALSNQQQITTYVNYLMLSNNQLSSVPTASIQSLAASLQSLDMSFNNIANISSNSFYGCIKINNINLNNNPNLTNLEPGAFNNLISMTALYLSYLNQLSSVDLLIAYGMTNLNMLSFRYVALEQIYVSDASKLPSELSDISLNGINTLKVVDSSLENWLKVNQTNVYNFSYNAAFPCNDDIQWMAKYAVCIPVQIITDFTTCQDGTTLLSYLQNMIPSC